jgi:hypothetical protein
LQARDNKCYREPFLFYLLLNSGFFDKLGLVESR